MPSPLASRISGPVFEPADPGYAEELSGFNLAIRHTPQLVVGVQSEADVVEAVRYAREQNWHVTVQSTGHGAQTPVTSGLFISTKRLDQFSIDVENRIATIGAGVRWGAVVAEATQHGLLPITGSSPTVGAIGYLLGGGLGPLARSHGFSSDYIVSARIVTGAGELLEAAANQNPDLLWALRGGKVGLGVVTQVRIRLPQVDHLYGGSLFFSEENIATALRAWVDWTTTADPAVTTSIAIIHFPPFEAVPAPFRGRILLSVRFAYPGPAAEGERLAAPLRAAAPIHLDALGELPISQIARVHSDPLEPVPSYVRGLLLNQIDQQFADIVLQQVGAGTDSPFTAVEIRHIGQASHIDVPEGSAVGGRPARYSLAVVASNPTQFQTIVPAAIQKLFAAAQPWACSETNANFASKFSSAQHFASAWPPATFERLTQLRQHYDPQSLFAYHF